MARPKSESPKTPTTWQAEQWLLDEIEKQRLSRFPIPSQTDMFSELIHIALHGPFCRCANGNGRREE